MPFPIPGKIKCPVCGYGLLGLPAVHVCPECGVEYDPHCVVVRLKGRSRAASNAIGGLFLTVLFVGHLVAGTLPAREILPVAVLLGAMTIVAMYRWAWHCGRERLLIISHAGVRLRHPNLSDEVVLWSRFGKARINWVTGGFLIRGRDGELLLKCRSNQLGSLLQVRYCVEQMNRLAEVYAAEADSPVT